MKKKSLKNRKLGYLIHCWPDKAFKGTVGNRALPYGMEGHLKLANRPLKKKIEK